jgi:hypothetical protein
MTSVVDASIAVGPVYLAGPITPTPERTLEQHIDQAVRALRYLTARRVAAVCPQLTALRPELHALPGVEAPAGAPTYEDWMEVDFVLLKACRAVFALPGWDRSAGVRRELLVAGAAGIPIFYTVPTLMQFLGAVDRVASLRPATATFGDRPSATG